MYRVLDQATFSYGVASSVKVDQHTSEANKYIYQCAMADTNAYVDTVYTVTNHSTRSSRGSLVDRGANGGILGCDAKPFFTHTRTVNVTGIDNHELNHLKIVDASAKVMTQRGPVVVILKQ